MTLQRSRLRTKPYAELTVKPKKAKPRKCGVRGCREAATSFSSLAAWCTPEHGVILAQAALAKKKEREAKAERKADREKLEEMKPRKWWKAKLKKALHAYIRARDEGKECASCDTILLKLGRLGGDYDAGHFRSVGSAKHLEFEEKNIFGQCKHCNDFLKGNQLEYERRLRIRMGDAYVDELLANNETRKYTIADFQEMEAHYKTKLKDLLASRAGSGEE